MIFQLFRRSTGTAIIHRVYGAIVAQARSPAFYRDYGIPDTVNGRFELVLLHTVLFLRRTGGETGTLRELGQGVFDTFCDDMDATLREMGIGDLGVPRQMRRVADAFYGRQQTYEHALAEGDAAVAELLQRVFASAHLDAVRLTAYLKAAGQALVRCDAAEIEKGQLGFPDPAQIVATGAAE